MASPFQRKFTANLSTFTDRTEFKKMLKAAVETPQAYDEHRMKVIYGLGGQGKTYLKTDFLINDYLKIKAKEDKNLIYCDGIDFERIESSRSVENGLLSVAKDLIEKGKIPLPAFCLAFLKLKQLTSLSRNLQEQYPYLFAIKGNQFTGSGVAGEAVQEIVDFAVGSGLSEAAASIPLLGFFVKNLVNSGKNKIIKWLRESDAEAILGELDEMDKYQLIEKLPMFLGWDVYQALKRDAENGSPSRRIVIVIDGYETLWSGEKNINLNKDLWVRQLFQYMTGVLFVIFGREALRWHEVEQDQQLLDSIEQHPIDGFDDEDANSFLEQVPIVEEEIRMAIIRNAKGSYTTGRCFPLYLQLEAKSYEIIMNSGRKPTHTDFAEGNEKTETAIVNRLFKHMDPSVSTAMEALSLCRFIDDSIIELMESERAFPPASVSVRSLSDYSFIVKEGNRTLIHGFVRNIASEQYAEKHPDRFKRLHKALFDHFDSQLPTINYHIVSEALEQALLNAGHHKRICDPAGFAGWIIERAGLLYGRSMLADDATIYLLRLAIEDLEPGDKIDYENYDDNKRLTLAQLFYLAAERHEAAVDYTKALDYIRLSIRGCQYVFPDKTLNDLKSAFVADSLAQSDRDKIRIYKKAVEKAAELSIQIDDNISAGKYFQRARDLGNDFKLGFDENIFMSYLTSIGRYAEAECFYYSRYTQAIKSLDSARSSQAERTPGFEASLTNTVFTASNAAADLAAILRLQGRYDEALRFVESALKLMEEEVGPAHLYTAFAKQRLARTLIRANRDLEHAARLLNEVEEIYKVSYSPSHLYVGYLHVDYFELKRYSDAEAAMEHVTTALQIIANKSRGLNGKSIDLIVMLTKLAYLQTEGENLGQLTAYYENMLVKMFEDRLEDIKNLYGVFNPSLHEGMNLVAEILEKKGKILDAELTRRSVREFQRLMHNLNHVRVNNLATSTVPEGDKAAALTLFRTVTSLPEDDTAVNVEVTELPFYRTFNLYKITFLGTKIPVIKIILSDMERALEVDRTNAPIYTLGESDLQCDTDSVIPYAIFFFDTVIGRAGKFYLFRDDRDIPWKIDVDVFDHVKHQFADLIEPLHLIADEPDKYVLRGSMMFRKYIFTSDIHVQKSSGLIALDNERHLKFYESDDGQIGVLDSDNPPSGKIRMFEEIPACIDPVYEEVSSTLSEPKTLLDHLKIGFKQVENDMVFLHPLVERNEDEQEAFNGFVANFNKLSEDLAGTTSISLSLFKSVLFYSYNVNADVYNQNIQQGNGLDSFLPAIRIKLELYDSVIQQIENHLSGAEE